MNEFQIPHFQMFDLASKEDSFNYYMGYMLARTQRLFEWSGLPDSIPQRDMELLIQTKGHCCITDVGGELYALWGNFGGEPDPYYIPTLYVVSNPALAYSKSLKINEDCVILKNDSMYLGLYPVLGRYSTQMVENDLSMLIADINTRMISIITASDEATRKSAIKYLEDIKKGVLGVPMTNEFLEGIKCQPFATQGMSNTITQLIEYQQYLKASMFNEIGLNANYNMKREAINTSEAQLNNDALYPLIDDMLEMRKQGAEEINIMFGTDISVKLASVWGRKALEEDALIPDDEADADEEPVTEPEGGDSDE